MTDKEIIALVESKLPQELSLDEIDVIRQRMRASPTVRHALAAQLELDQYLAGLIGKVEMSPEAIIARAVRASRFRRSSIFSWLGWTAGLVMVGFVVSLLVWALFIRPDDNAANMAQADGQAKLHVAKKPEVAPADDNSSAETKINEAQAALEREARGTKPAGDFLPNGPRLEINPSAIIAPEKRTAGVIEIPAVKVARMDHLTLDRTEYGRGLGVLSGEHGWAEFDFASPRTGVYQLELRYAAATSRPLRLTLNGIVVKERAAAEITGNWFPEGQQQFAEANVTLRQGRNTLRLESEGAFPHVSRIAFVPAKAEANVTSAPPRPVAPWLTEENLGAAPRPMEEIAYDQFDLLGTSPSLRRHAAMVHADRERPSRHARLLRWTNPDDRRQGSPERSAQRRHGAAAVAL